MEKRLAQNYSRMRDPNMTGLTSQVCEGLVSKMGDDDIKAESTGARGRREKPGWEQ